MRRGPVIRALVLSLAVAVGGAACSRTRVAGSPGGHRSMAIVAGENFWGSIVGQLAGTVGHVTSLVTDPNADPHDYQSSAADARAFATADYVVLNGAGYDSWADQLLSGNASATRKVFTVAGLVGKKEGDNPHLWYNPDYVSATVNQVEQDLKAIDPADAAYFDTQRAAFDQAYAPVLARLAQIRAKFAGTAVASTESIVVYLAQYLGLNVVSPPAFMNAVSEGNDPPAPAVATFQNQLTGRQARILVYNQQTSTDVTTNLKTLATRAGIPLVAVTETIQPPGTGYQQWFEGELEQLQAALSAGATPTP